MKYTEKFIREVGRIVLQALENSGADMSQITDEFGGPDKEVFKNISGQYAETVVKARNQKPKKEPSPSPH